MIDNDVNAAVEAIRTCKSLLMYTLSEPEDNSLRIVLLETRAGDPPTLEQLDAEPLLAGATSVVHGAGCRVFELMWPSYVGYAIENESYRVPEPRNSVGEGRLMVKYMQSAYLTYLLRATFEGYVGDLVHWALHCENHIVNVASVDAPLIKVTTAI